MMTDMENTLLIRHLPSDLDSKEKKDLLHHFGAQRVRVMGCRGSMKHTAFATFPDHDQAKQALQHLHQLDILGCKLIVEFAKKSQQKHFPDFTDDKRDDRNRSSKKAVTNGGKEDKKSSSLQPLPSDDTIYKKWSIEYPRNPKLYYLYPPPTVSVLTNIANALASYPKFYVQVLHLMNKMNLPAPFGPVTPTPPIREDYDEGVPGEDNIEMEEMEVSSTEESEIESDGEGGEKLISDKPLLKRPSRNKPKQPRKKPKLLQEAPQHVEPSLPAMKTSEVFEQPQQQVGPKKIQLNVRGGGVGSNEPVLPEKRADILEVVDTQPEISEGGFGKIEPKEKVVEKEIEESDLPYNIDPSKFFTREELRNGRIVESEMKNFSVFKNYSSGEVTTRLYIKNLAKHTTEQQLANVFGQYVDWKSELEKNMFDIQLMKVGRMKGQAFVTLPNDTVAAKALKDTNGFVLNSKPMVVQFARSAKAKETTNEKPSKKDRNG